MPWQDLVNYIYQQIQQGHQIEEIRSYLYSLNYPGQDIEYAIGYVQQQQIIQYTRSYLTRGYTPKQIQKNLIKYRYPNSLIEHTFKQMGISPTKNHHPLIVIGGIVTLVIFVSVLCVWYLIPDEPIQPLQLDIQVRSFTDTVTLPQNIRFAVDLSNFGSTSRYDVHLTYSLVNRDTGDRYNLGEEVVSIETQRSVVKDLHIPDSVITGSYDLKAEVSYGQIMDYAKTSVYIEHVDKPESVSNETSKEENATISRPKNSTSTPTYNSNNLNMIEILNNIQQIAQDDIDKAIELCSTITYEIYRNDCIAKVAKATDDESICGAITSSAVRDNCYSQIAGAKPAEDATCDNIDDENRKDLCLLDLGVKSLDENVCEKIVTPTMKSLCVTRVQNRKLVQELVD